MLTILSESWNDLQLIMNTFSSNFTGEGDYVASADRLLSLNSFVDLTYNARLRDGPLTGSYLFSARLQ